MGHDLGNRDASLAGDGARGLLGPHTVCQIGRGRLIALCDRCDRADTNDQRGLDLQQACPMTNARRKQRQQGDEWV